MHEALLCCDDRCNLCHRKCRIKSGESGYCGARININGKIYTLTYGNLSAIELRPMEIALLSFLSGKLCIDIFHIFMQFSLPLVPELAYFNEKPYGKIFNDFSRKTC